MVPFVQDLLNLLVLPGLLGEKLLFSWRPFEANVRIEYHPQGPEGPPVEIDFTPPWPRISMVEEIEKKSGITVGLLLFK